MKRKQLMKLLSAILSLTMVFSVIPSTQAVYAAASSRYVEALSRGLSVIQVASGVQISWRYLATDTENTTFMLYRNGEKIYTSSKDMATSYYDKDGKTTDTYTLQTYHKGTETIPTETADTEYTFAYDKTGKGGYFDMALDVPPTDSRTGATYTPNDASVADLDGDGDYELIIKWDPSNSQDNSNNGETGNVIIDAYQIEAGDATRLWRVDLGQNIRAGAHYTQFMVYDFDGDGKAEMACKTAPGSKDGKGNYVSSASTVSNIKNASDNSKSYVDSSGRILTGSEYLTLFDGQSGAALDTIYYNPSRGTVKDWGDNYGNRVDRFLAGVAYLNGSTPSLVMCRGYYTRTVIATYNVEGKRLKENWVFDTNSSGNSAYAAQGNHNLVTADADGDGYDEIVYGSMTVDHNGKGLYSTGLKHGDALHVGDFLPNRSGLEVYQVLEETYGASLRDAKTGKSIYRWSASSDTGRGVADNLIAGNGEAEFCASSDSVIYNSSGEKVANWSDITKWGQNSLIYWDDDLEREVLDRTMVDGYGKGRLFTGQNVTYNNSSKSNMCITADIMGDWREEIVAPLSDGSGGVRVYITPYNTDYRIYTLMHNTQYRCGVAAENVGYNQPPHVDYWLGTGDALPALPNVYTVNSVPVSDLKAEFFGSDITQEKFTADTTVGSDNKFRVIASETTPVEVLNEQVEVGNMTIEKGLRLTTKASDSAVEITANKGGTLYIGALSGHASSDRNLVVYNSSGTRVGVFSVKAKNTANGKVDLQTITLPSADTYTIYSNSGPIVIYYIGSTADLKAYPASQQETTTETTTTTSTTESSTEATTVTVNCVNGKYSFDGLKGKLTDEANSDSAYLEISGTAKNDGEIAVIFNNDGYAYVKDEDTGATANLILPVKDNGNYITVSGSFKPVSASNKWTLFQISGNKTDNTASEIVGIRTDSNNYKLRLMGNELVDSGVAVKADTSVRYTVVIDKTTGRAELTIDNKTVGGEIDCAKISRIKFVTAGGARSIYVGSTEISQILLGDADNNGVLDNIDSAFILKHLISDINNISSLADFDRNGEININDAVNLMKYMGGN